MGKNAFSELYSDTTFSILPASILLNINFENADQALVDASHGFYDTLLDAYGAHAYAYILRLFYEDKQILHIFDGVYDIVYVDEVETIVQFDIDQSMYEVYCSTDECFEVVG